jgi:hypothetical protein
MGSETDNLFDLNSMLTSVNGTIRAGFILLRELAIDISTIL